LGKEHAETCEYIRRLETEGTTEDEDAHAHALVEEAWIPGGEEGGGGGVLHKHVEFDLELFATFEHSHDAVIQALDHTTTAGGRKVLERILTAPLRDHTALERRQESLKCLAGRKRPQTLDREQERDALWLLRECNQTTQVKSQSTTFATLLDIVRFTTWLTRPLNRVPVALDVYNMYRRILSPALHIAGPLLYALIPYLIVRVWMGLPIPITTYLKVMWRSGFLVHQHGVLVTIGSMLLSTLLYIQGAFAGLDLAMMARHVTRYVTRRVSSAMDFAHNARCVLRACGPHIHPSNLHIDMCIPPEPLKRFHTTLWPSRERLARSPDSALAMFCNPGAFDADAFRAGLLATYVADCAMGIARLSMLQPSSSYCWTSFEGAKRGGGGLKFQGLLHPCLPPDGDVVRNDVTLEGHAEEGDRHFVITGPNAGGKSTLIKALGLGVLCSQTLTLACAQSATLCPVSFLATHINVPDRTGTASLFQAQLAHISDILHRLSQTPERALIIADELFNSTNPAEGEAAAWAIARALFRRGEGVNVVLTTHFRRMAEELSTLSGVHAARMESYRLQDGISDQRAALQLLRDAIKGALPPHDSDSLDLDLETWVLL
jgi:hypothetical protein